MMTMKEYKGMLASIVAIGILAGLSLAILTSGLAGVKIFFTILSGIVLVIACIAIIVMLMGYDLFIKKK